MRPRKSISKSLIIQQPNPAEEEHTGKAKEHFQHLRQKLKAIPHIAQPASPKAEQQVQSKKRRDKKGKKVKQQKANYQLEVSETSSSSFTSDESFDKEIKNELTSAREALKKLSRQPNTKNNSSFINSPLQQPGAKVESQKDVLDGEKLNINFVKALMHNNESKDINEYFEDGYLNINIQSDDMLTFLRYEHEVQEMIHRSQMFADNKHLHDGLQDEIENYQIRQDNMKKEREERQKEFVQQILQQEQQKQNFLHRAKTKKIGDIANKFIDRHHIDLKNDPVNLGHLSKRKQEYQ